MRTGLKGHLRAAQTSRTSIVEQPMTAIESQRLVSSLVDPDLVAVCLFAALGLAVTALFLSLGFAPDMAQALAY
jgi:hypothetical protein